MEERHWANAEETGDVIWCAVEERTFKKKEGSKFQGHLLEQLVPEVVVVVVQLSVSVFIVIFGVQWWGNKQKRD